MSDITFVIPARNEAPRIAAAVASALGQSVPPAEVLVIDDHSSDDTAVVARQCGARVVSNRGRGLVAALNCGLSETRTPLVARLDADDVASADRLALQLPLLANHTVVDGQVELVRPGGIAEGMQLWQAWINGLLTADDIDRELLVESPVVHPAATYSRQAVLDVGGYRQGDFPEDYDLWLRLHAAGHRFAKVAQVVVTMLDRPERLTRTDPRYSRDAFRRARWSWLASTVLASPRRVVLWGAGKECRPWVRWLRDNGHTLVAVLEISGRGTRRGDAPILDPQALVDLDCDYLFMAVGARGARQEIRGRIATLRPEWAEGRDWWAVR